MVTGILAAVVFIALSFFSAYFLSQNLPPKKRLAVLALVPLLSLVIYLAVGSPALEDRPQAHLIEQNRLNPAALTALIENKLALDPNQYNGWQTLASIQLAIGNFYQAEEAYRRADKIKPNQTATLVGIAQTKFFANKEIINQETRNLLLRSLKQEPDNLVALYLLAKAQTQEGKSDAAIKTLTKTKKIAQSKKNKEFTALIQEALDKIKK